MKSNQSFIKPIHNNEPKPSCQDTNQELVFENIFEAVDEKKATGLKENSDLLIALRDILAANKISSPAEHLWALKRIEHLWLSEPDTEQGDELKALVEIVCKYEDNFFS